MTPINLSKSDIDHLVEIVATQAANAPGVGPQGYFSDLVSRTNLKSNFKLQLAGTWTGNALVDARKLFNWALSKPVNPVDSRYTTIGSFLENLLDDLDLIDQRWIVSLIIVNDLYIASSLIGQLKATYNVPDKSDGNKNNVVRAGPDFDWWGPKDEIELQSWLQPEPEYEDVGTLMKVVNRAASVCRIQFSHIDRRGTGFLIAPNLVLTNYHVLKETAGEDLVENAKTAVLYFGKVSLGDGSESPGKKFHLVATDPVPASSPVDQLDYALLQVDEQIKSEESVQPSPLSIQLPALRDALGILQHPMGKELKLARSNNGVAAINEELGRIQYYTMAEGGSSGSPCYNKNWEVVALHHAERSSGLGVRREGVLIKAIYQQIKGFF